MLAPYTLDRKLFVKSELVRANKIPRFPGGCFVQDQAKWVCFTTQAFILISSQKL